MNNNAIALIPLDERPVNTRYPQMLGAIAGIDVLMPPVEARGYGRTPADLAVVAGWLRDIVLSGVSAVVVSCDFLAYGNLINARISNDDAITVLDRLSILGTLSMLCPVHVFSLVTRVANADDCVEEPSYWLEWGTRLYRFAHLSHRAECGALTPEEGLNLVDLSESIPADLKTDWLVRRLRNHTVNLALLEMAARGKLSTLLITSDDTAPYGFPTRERDWLLSWRELVGEPAASRVQAYPGADEVGSALVARTINEARGRRPKVWIEYAIDGDRDLVALYEDRPVEETVIGQISACGCDIAASIDSADFVLGVVTPSPRRTDYLPEFALGDEETRTEAYRRFIDILAEHQASGRQVALADVAYPNGADPLFAHLLLAPDVTDAFDCGQLAAYGAWNTAGNTLGVVVAEAALSIYAETCEQKDAARLFLAHRFLEDAGYQAIVRREARDEAERLWGKREPDPDCATAQHELSLFIEGRLEHVLAGLRRAGIGERIEIVPASTRLPWRRTFEVDFELQLA